MERHNQVPGSVRERIGKRVMIGFEEEDESTKFFLGEIQGVRFERGKNDDDEEDNEDEESDGKTIVVKHRVVFDDGDDLWLDLDELAKDNRFRWDNQYRKPSTKRSAPTTSAATNASSKRKKRGQPNENVRTPQRRRTKTEPSEESIVIVSPSPKKKTKESADRGDSTDDEEETESRAHLTQDSQDQPLTSDGEGKRNDSDDESTEERRIANSDNEDDRKMEPEPPLPPFHTDPRHGTRAGQEALLKHFRWWLCCVHETKKGKLSKQNCASVMRQAQKLIMGTGITYKHWPKGVGFEVDVEHTLETDFRALHQLAKAHEAKYGKDKGNGWLLLHPIHKLALYKEYLQNERIDTVASWRGSRRGQKRP